MTTSPTVLKDYMDCTSQSPLVQVTMYVQWGLIVGTQRIMNKAWRVMVQDPYLQEVFPQPPMVAYRRPPSLRSVLVKAKVPPLPIRQSNRTHNGMKRCSKCVVCPYVTEQRIVKSSQNCFVHNINKPVNCDSSNVVYLVECKKCKEQYVGQTGRAFKERMKEHIGYIKGKKLTEPTGLHFNLPGHNLSMFQASIIEKWTMTLEHLEKDVRKSSSNTFKLNLREWIENYDFFVMFFSLTVLLLFLFYLCIFVDFFCDIRTYVFC